MCGSRYVAVLLAALAGCGTEDPCPVEPQQWTELGIGLYVEPGAAEWTSAIDLAEQVDRTAGVVAQYAGRPASQFGGTIVALMAAERVDCHPWGLHPGCAHGGTWIDVGTSYPGVTRIELSALAHELLHILIGDHNHDSPLWEGLEEYARPRIANPSSSIPAM